MRTIASRILCRPCLGSALLPVAALLCLAALAPATASAAGKVHITGTAYAFDNQMPIAGATIRVAELRGAKATTAADGTYDLVVPDGARVTPFIEAANFHGIYLQTFVTTGTGIQRVNFQVPSIGIYHALAALLGVQLNADDNPSRCVVVSTFSTVKVRDLSFDDFVAYGAHGVAGATAGASPSLLDPIYFNSSVIPDVSLTESSVDGGVIWLNIPGGVYRFTADHPTARFSSFVATCRAGRLVNANPPQGLYQLKPGEPGDAGVEASLVSSHFRVKPSGPRVLELGLRASEYVLPDARILRGGRQIAGKRPARFAEGARNLSINFGRKLAAGPLRLRLAISDGVGNSRVIEKNLALPPPAPDA